MRSLLPIFQCAVLVSSLPSPSIPTNMKAATALQGSELCDKPTWTCISESTVLTPKPSAGQLLLKMGGSSVNPVNVDLVEPECRSMQPPFGCTNGTLGNDGAGTVIEVGEACDGFAVGDHVWGFIQGSYAEFAVADCGNQPSARNSCCSLYLLIGKVGLAPKSLSLIDAGTIPVVGGTSLQCLNSAGLPSKRSNLTVVVTAGQGGTGFIGVQLAKALGASRVITAATGDGIPLMHTLGADVVVDYHQQSLAAVLSDNSVDIVYDNLGVPGTADKLMHAIRPGGTFLVLMGGNGGTVSKHPKQGVHQISFGLATAAKPEMDHLARLFDDGKLQPHTMEKYTLAQVPEAFTRLRSSGVLGKLSIVTQA